MNEGTLYIMRIQVGQSSAIITTSHVLYEGNHLAMLR